MRHLGADIKTAGRRIMVQGPARLAGRAVFRPRGYLRRGIFLSWPQPWPPGESSTSNNLGVNPTRSGLLDLYKADGGDLPPAQREREVRRAGGRHLLVKGGRNLRGIKKIKCGGEDDPRG